MMMMMMNELFVVPHTQRAKAWITQQSNACLCIESVHQMAPPQTEVADI